MQTELYDEARRQAEICNACRYCEGFCSVFPALQSHRAFADANLTQLANLCHNCRSCYYACQYTEPHEFGINLPKILAEVRQDSWETFAFPQAFARPFQRNGVAISIITAISFAIIFWIAKAFQPTSGDGFYAVISHSMMVAIFAPAFLFPLFSIAISLRRYWRATGGGRLKLSHIIGAFKSAMKMKNLAGGHGDGCNFEEQDKYSQKRKYAHQAVMYGFLLCFASTCSGTVLHYLFDLPAPYSFWSLPKLLGVPGGILLSLGSIWMIALKLRADKQLSNPNAWGGEMGFVILLGVVGLSGLALYVFGNTKVMPVTLAIHLGSVLSFFLLTPYSKMAHGFYRLAALVKDQQQKAL